LRIYLDFIGLFFNFGKKNPSTRLDPSDPTGRGQIPQNGPVP
jgi:hypothetical protein